MITEPIDYSGCDPQIAKMLKRNRAIKCKLRSHGSPIEGFVVGYLAECDFSYVSRDGGCYLYAEPIEAEYRVKDTSALIEALIGSGYTYKKNGVWRKPDAIPIHPDMWSYQGKLILCTDGRWLIEGWEFIKDWVEEVNTKG
jgi:hypothetical protein